MRNTPISKPYVAAETVLWSWLTNPQEHTSSWRTNQQVFPRNPLCIFNSARSSIVTAERYLVDPLIQWTRMIVCWCSWMKVIEKMMKMKYLSGFFLLQKLMLTIHFYDHSILLCKTTLIEIVKSSHIYIKTETVRINNSLLHRCKLFMSRYKIVKE